MAKLGKLTPIPRRPREGMTVLELAEEAVDDARTEFECARVRLNGAEERLRIIQRFEWSKWTKGKPRK